MKCKISKKILSMLAVAILVISMMPITAFAETILYAEVTGIDVPVAGKKPDMTAVPSNSNYTVTKVSWDEYDTDWEFKRELSANDTFKPGCIYVVWVKLKIKDGSTFGEQNRLNTYINGKTCHTTGPKDNGTTLDIYTNFETPKSKISSISLNVTAPVEGAKPSFNKVSGTGFYSDNAKNPVAIYKNGIAWYKSSTSYIGAGTTATFEAGKDYTVKVSLVVQDGYEFADNVGVTINGKKATVDIFDDSITAYVTLTATAKTTTPSKPTETPKKEEVKNETPKVEEPKVEEPITEEPEVENPIENEDVTTSGTNEKNGNKKDTKSLAVIIAVIAAIVLIALAGIALTIIIIVSIVKKKKKKVDNQ